MTGKLVPRYSVVTTTSVSRIQWVKKYVFSIYLERQHAEGDDNVDAEIFGDGGGGGDGSSGHSDDDMGGDGGVAIRTSM